MSEENMVKLMQDALAEQGIHDTVLAAGSSLRVANQEQCWRAE